MLLLTDRPAEGLHFQQVFGRARTCDMVTLEEATNVEAEHDVIACHADLTSRDTCALLDVALTYHRATVATPVLFLISRDTDDARKEAFAFGATEVMLENASQEHLLFTMRRMHRRLVAEVPTTSKETERSVEHVGGALLHLLNAAGRNEALSLPALDRSADVLIASVRKDTIKAWLDIVRRYDNLTYQHCMLVAGLVTAFSARLGLAPASQRILVQAALVHDIGKAQVPHAILNKPGALTPAEMQIMKTHPGIGHGLLVRQAGLHPSILDVVRHHHEYIDGSGYPDRLQGKQVSDFARIVTICDIYGALIERRPYRSPMAPHEARAVLRDMGTKLDAGFLAVFDNVIRDS